MTEREWDKRLRIKTIGRENEDNPHYSPYEPTPYSVLQRLADSGHIGRKAHLLDYGCGKGRVAFFMAATVGCRVTGIDQSQKLIDMAKENRRASGLGDRVRLECCLAEQYAVKDETAFFFFNPFSGKVFGSVLRQLSQRGAGKLILYYPSEEYMTRLNLMPEVEHVDTIDCRDLFNGKNDRERIEVFRLMNADGDTGDRHSRTVPNVPHSGSSRQVTPALRSFSCALDTFAAGSTVAVPFRRICALSPLFTAPSAVAVTHPHSSRPHRCTASTP